MAEQRVYEQMPPMLPVGSRVIISVSQGPNPVTPTTFVDVPDVVGQAQGQALARLQEHGFSARVFNDYSDSYARGHVMGQLPSAGSSRADGAEVALLVSSGSAVSHTKSGQLPDVVGMDEGEAVVALQKAEFSPQVVREFSQTVPAGIVTSQLPDRAWLAAVPEKRPNWMVWVATVLAVLALIAIGYFVFGRGSNATVPNVVGKTAAQAQTALEGAGFVAQAEATQVAGAKVGSVVAQDPAAGGTARKGSTVTIQVAAGAATVSVPDVVGLPSSSARSQIEAAGLNASVVEEPRSGVAVGAVAEQRPAAGTSVAEGSQVTLIVAAQPNATAASVPGVTGLTRSDAEAAIEDAGFRVVAVENPSSVVAVDVVVSQYPAAGQQLPPGTNVSLVVSSGVARDATSTVSVPNVLGLELPDAQEELAKAGLRSQPVVIDGTDSEANVVVGQMPAGREQAYPSQTTIVLIYSSGK